MILVIAVISCQSEKKEISKNENLKNKPAESLIESDTSLWVTDGNMKNDTILLISQGGPKWYLDIEEHGKTNYRYIPKYSDFGIAFIHQSQTLDDRILNSKTVISLKEAKQEVEKNSNMLDKAITYFKRKNKTVIVIGKSHGAYVIQDYLATKTSLADKYFIIAGRLMINNEMTQQQLKGFNGEFSDDGLIYIPEDENADLSKYSEKEINEYKNKQMLKAGYGATDYTSKLSQIDLSNVTYIYGTKDKNIGRLTQKEIEFLKSKKVKVIETETDHSDVTYAFVDRLVDGRLTL